MNTAIAMRPAPTVMLSSAIEAEISALDREFYAMSADAELPVEPMDRRNALVRELVRRRVQPRTVQS